MTEEIGRTIINAMVGRLDIERREKGMTVKEVAAKSGLSVSGVTFALGCRNVPTAYSLMRLADALGYDLILKKREE